MITKLTEKIWIIQGGKIGLSQLSHSLFIREDGGYLIDAGAELAEIERLRKEEGISTVIMSHYHIDHSSYLSALPGTEVWATKEDAPAIESLDTYLYWIDAFGNEWEAPTRKMFIEEYHYCPTQVTRFISDGEEIRFGKTRAVALLAPGHTAGHLCFHFPDHGILFLGDYNLLPFGPLYTDMLSDIDAFRRSSRFLAGIGAETCVVSHGEPVHRGPIYEKTEAYLSAIDRREEIIRDFLRKEPRTPSGFIAGHLIYGSARRQSWMDRSEWALIWKHLEGMIRRGEAALHDGSYVLIR